MAKKVEKFLSVLGGRGGGYSNKVLYGEALQKIIKPERFLDFFTSTENLLSVSPFEPFYPRI